MFVQHVLLQHELHLAPQFFRPHQALMIPLLSHIPVILFHSPSQMMGKNEHQESLQNQRAHLALHLIAHPFIFGLMASSSCCFCFSTSPSSFSQVGSILVSAPTFGSSAISNSISFSWTASIYSSWIASAISLSLPSSVPTCYWLVCTAISSSLLLLV